MCTRSADSTGGQVASGPAGVQRYSASAEGSTFGLGGMHSQTLGVEDIQHGLWSRTSTVLPIRRRNFRNISIQV